jgi:PHD/YefM family antitoxin component YafN of YafNO toxin-antitoxin module
MSTIVSTREVRQKFSHFLNMVIYGKERLGISRNGEAVVFMISPEDMRLFEALEDKYDPGEIDEILAAIDSGEAKTYSLEEAAVELGVDIPDGE